MLTSKEIAAELHLLEHKLENNLMSVSTALLDAYSLGMVDAQSMVRKLIDENTDKEGK